MWFNWFLLLNNLKLVAKPAKTNQLSACMADELSDQGGRFPARAPPGDETGQGQVGEAGLGLADERTGPKDRCPAQDLLGKIAFGTWMVPIAQIVGLPPENPQK